MAHVRTRVLLVAATLMSGILAGGVIDRIILGTPAWYQLGTEAWLQYSRQADLGAGLLAYPIEGIGNTLLLIAAAVSSYLDGNRRRCRRSQTRRPQRYRQERRVRAAYVLAARG